MTTKGRHLIVLAGPTAVGKTDLSVSLAEHFGCDIISGDSRQFYQEMSIGTAKPTPEEMRAVPHHFVDSHSIKDQINAGDFEKLALAQIEACFKTNSMVILTGGSGLFLKAVYDGLDQFPDISNEAKETVSKLYQTEGIEGLQRQLQQLDPDYYNTVDIQNPHRIMRALEVCLSSHQPYSNFLNQSTSSRPFKTFKIALNRDREELYDRINQRVDIMMKNGLLEEVQSLLPFEHLSSMQTVGYQELFPYLKNEISLAEAISLIKRNSRRYAKRQLTWFRREKDFEWFHPSEKEEIIKFIEKVISE